MFEMASLDRTRWTPTGWVRTKPFSKLQRRELDHPSFRRPPWMSFTREEFEDSDWKDIVPPYYQYVETVTRRQILRQWEWENSHFEKSTSNLPKIEAKYCPYCGSSLGIYHNETEKDPRKLNYWYCINPCEYRYYWEPIMNNTRVTVPYRQTQFRQDVRNYDPLSPPGLFGKGTRIYDIDKLNEDDPIKTRQCKECPSDQMAHMQQSRSPKPGYVNWYRCIDCGAVQKNVVKKGFKAMLTA